MVAPRSASASRPPTRAAKIALRTLAQGESDCVVATPVQRCSFTRACPCCRRADVSRSLGRQLFACGDFLLEQETADLIAALPTCTSYVHVYCECRNLCVCVCVCGTKNAHTRRAVGRGHLLLDVCARFWTQALAFGHKRSILEVCARVRDH